MFIVTFLYISCTNENAPSVGNREESRVRKIAVFCSEESMDRLKKTADWAMENLTKAQGGCAKKLTLQLEWHDEDSPGLADLAYRISTNPEYSLIIGPEKSSAAYRVAQQVESRIPMILPIATATELQRIYGGDKGLWFLTQSDITQSEILLTQAKLEQFQKVTLLASDDEYGRSFNDWFSYQAIELGLEVGQIILYSSASELNGIVESLNGHKQWYEECLIYAPSKPSDALVLDEAIGNLLTQLPPRDYLRFPKVYCSDVVASSHLAGKLSNLRYEGISPSAHPKSGWTAAYRGRFHEDPANGTAQFYDGVMLAAYALFAQNENEPLNSTIMRLVDAEGGPVCGGWTASDMNRAFLLLESGGQLTLQGITSEWRWDAKNHNSVTGTTYAHWVYSSGTFNILEYLTLNGSDGTISSSQAWEWESSHQQEFDDNVGQYDYPHLKERYAVVIAASDTWANYRHQADALAMYQLLKQHGYDDSHIILIMEDNIAYDSRNKYPGEVRVEIDGENLYHDVKVDYKISELTLDDLTAILSGQRTSRLPETVAPSEGDNVIMFWCGHGSQNTLMWGTENYVYGDDVRTLVEKLKEEKRYRKFLLVIDACYAGTIGEACEGIPGTLVFTAAHPNETSKADVFDGTLNVWLSNGFTRTFREKVSANPSISFKNLYYECVRGTTGSHPHIYNTPLYGNMQNETLKEFF